MAEEYDETNGEHLEADEVATSYRSAKEYYLHGGGRMYAALDEPMVQEWIRGTWPVTPGVVALLGSEWEMLVGMDADYVAHGGVILPAIVCYVVESSEMWEETYTIGMYGTRAMAEAVAEEYNREEALEHGDDGGRHASVSVEPLWLPAPG